MSAANNTAGQPLARAPSALELSRVGFTSHLPEIPEVEVFVVDDERTSLELLEACAARLGHPVRAFSDPAVALREMADRVPQILVTDVVMPEMSGVELVRRARELDPDIAVIFVTGADEAEGMVSTLTVPAVSLLRKPVGVADLTQAVQRAHLQYASDRHHRAMIRWAEESAERKAEELREVTLGTLGALMNAMDARSPHFVGHSRAVSLQAAAVAQALGLPEDEVETIRTAGLLHDVGMIGVPDSVIDKIGTLTEHERELIRQHCETGAAILAPMTHLGDVTTYVAQHHERWDGSGYPDGLRGDQISIGGQIVGIAEAWAAIMQDRSYREGRSRAKALEIFLQHQDEWFTEDVTLALIESDIGLTT